MVEPDPETQEADRDESPKSQETGSRRLLNIHLFNSDHSIDLEAASDAMLLDWEVKLSTRLQHIVLEIDNRLETDRPAHRVRSAKVHVETCLRIITKEMKRRRMLAHMAQDDARCKRKMIALVKALSDVMIEKFGPDVKDEIFALAKELATTKLQAAGVVEPTPSR